MTYIFCSIYQYIFSTKRSYTTIQGVHCTLINIFNFLSRKFFIKIRYSKRAIITRSWILTIHNARILRKKLLKQLCLTFKKWVAGGELGVLLGALAFLVFGRSIHPIRFSNLATALKYNTIKETPTATIAMFYRPLTSIKAQIFEEISLNTLIT